MAQIGTIRVDTQNNGTVDVPVFETGDSSSDVYEFVRVETASGTGFIPVTDTSNAAYPYLLVQSQNNGIVAITDTKGSTIPDSALYWPIDETSGPLVDEKINTEATLKGSPTFETTSYEGGQQLDTTGGSDGWETGAGAFSLSSDKWHIFGWTNALETQQGPMYLLGDGSLQNNLNNGGSGCVVYLDGDTLGCNISDAGSWGTAGATVDLTGENEVFFAANFDLANGASDLFVWNDSAQVGKQTGYSDSVIGTLTDPNFFSEWDGSGGFGTPPNRKDIAIGVYDELRTESQAKDDWELTRP